MMNYLLTLHVYVFYLVIIITCTRRTVYQNEIGNDNRISTYCKILNKSCVCDGKKTMHIIPFIPHNITKLTIQNCNFSNVIRDTFYNVENSSVEILKLKNCMIQFISKDAFKGLRKVVEFDLSSNYGLVPEVIAESLHSMSISRIERLYLTHMELTHLPMNMFAGLISTHISEIYLNHNFIKSLDGEVFRKLIHLRILDLSWTGISDFNYNFAGLSSLETLSLSGTWFSKVPTFCNGNQSYLPNLKRLDLDNSKIDSMFTPLTCLDNLKSLYLMKLSLRLLNNNTFSKLRSLEVLNLDQLGTQFQRIEPDAFNSKSLKNLTFSVTSSFSFNVYHIDKYHPQSLFFNCNQLEFLDLSDNRFQLTEYYWLQIFKPLKRLKELKLKNAKIEYLPTFKQNIFPVLKELNLASNRISSWKNSEPFDEIKYLRILNLRGNRISLINKTSFPESWNNGEGSLKTLLLVGNPFSCTCGLAWLRQWMDTTSAKNITTDKHVWRCSISNSKVLEYHPMQTFPCLVTYIIPSLMALFAILVTSFICYIFRFQIKLKLYRCKSRRDGYNLISNKGYVYDSFVAYSYNDLNWVKQHLIPKLETLHHLQLCIRDRDFRLGTVFSDHITENIEASRTFLLILSDNFARDKWCKFQLDIANHIGISRGDLAIIPVILKDISFNSLNEPIYNVINNTNCMVWSEDGPASELFWKKVVEYFPSSYTKNENSDSSASFSIQSFDSEILT
ncbi:toll-like receptor 4 [Mytilus trossulus]|uniref:toll-like receptor 4 n=1 Tax=Mytilus trossulus TaxID=6551 RepID=UPI0030046E32